MVTDQENRVQENLTDQTDREMVTDRGNQTVRVTVIDPEVENHPIGNLYMADLDTGMVIIHTTVTIIITVVDTTIAKDGTGRSALWHLVQLQG